MDGFEFHVSRRARDHYGFEDELFSTEGNVIFADFAAARAFAQKINAKRPPERAVRPGQINALGLIDEFQHSIIRAYREQKNMRVMAEALEWLTESIGAEAVEATLLRFVDEFPPVAVYQERISAAEYLTGETSGLPHRQSALEEMIMLWMANLNPAFAPFKELFDDAPLAEETAYPEIMAGLAEFFDEQPPFGDDHLKLLDLLRAPALAAPYSLVGQLAYIHARWGTVLGTVIARAERGLDFIREEERASFAGPGPAAVPVFGPHAHAASMALFGAGHGTDSEPYPEPERYSADLEWMPNLVLIAKNSYVWLDQLSKQYHRPITRLHQIPDEELDRLRRLGITGLWLIGLWERSPASRRIKQMMGNPEAVASAYSLLDYAIAEDLGGEEALANLRDRALRRGIRLASDMVPNHMGIDSRWVVEHPDWFIGLEDPPYPAYRFGGPDLSWDERVGIRIEDRYYDRADAAVVFQRTDKWTGSTRYIYHGNDGTSFPWNDTAQLNFLKPEVREAVIQTILHVARHFPIIRFDAAMTLAKRHYQRLWFPEPGTGGAIPSRSEHGLTRQQFDEAMPVEFWREVVDRTAAEAPDTLLLAEAFWLMEGYFVRTLGMHRVYNSAFMNMLRDEDNAKYRSVVKATLEFDPEVLKRYVNFMNNPDERTAVEQFGDGDKYFGVCVMLATLPGLPMIGHGQIEGYTEKYGMEYRRAYYDEHPIGWLVERHEREIVPLLHKRYLFSDSGNFLLYDLEREGGGVDENVFAYSNGRGDERALIVYHNKYSETRGWIRMSAAVAVKTGSGRDEKTLVRKSLRDGLGLCDDPAAWLVFRERITGLEYIRNCRELCEKGLYVELGAYKFKIFMDFRTVWDGADKRYSRIAGELGGGGVPDIEAAAREMGAKPIRDTFRELVHPGFLDWMWKNRVAAAALIAGGTGDLGAVAPAVCLEIEAKAGRVRAAVLGAAGADPRNAAAFDPVAVRRDLEAVLLLPAFRKRFPRPKSDAYAAAERFLLAPLESDRASWNLLFCFAAVHRLDQVRIADWGLDGIIGDSLRESGMAADDAAQAADLITALAAFRQAPDKAVRRKERPARLAAALFADEHMRRALRFNEYEGSTYFNKEAFERTAWALLAAAVIEATVDPSMEATVASGAIVSAFDDVRALLAAEPSSYLVSDLFIRCQNTQSPNCPEILNK
jgi:glycosidase